MLCRTARAWNTRPSALLGVNDPYTAYCIDEAGHYLISQKHPPHYTAKQLGKQAINRDASSVKALAALGAKINIDE